MKKFVIPVLIAIIAIVLIVVFSLSGNSTSNNNTNADNNDISSNDSNTISDTNNNINKKPEKIEKITEEILRDYPETPVSEFEYSSSTDYDGILIKSYNGDNDIVVIPEEIDGRPVVDISEYCFANSSKVRAVIIPKTVIEIGELFTNNENIEIVIAEGVEIVGEATFLNCTSLHTVKLSEKITEIRKTAFANCSELTKLRIPATAKLDNDDLYSFFLGCNKLTIYGEKGSQIEQIANTVGIPFVAE